MTNSTATPKNCPFCGRKAASSMMKDSVIQLSINGKRADGFELSAYHCNEHLFFVVRVADPDIAFKNLRQVGV